MSKSSLMLCKKELVILRLRSLLIKSNITILISSPSLKSLFMFDLNKTLMKKILQ